MNSLEDFKKIMRYNHYKEDPYSKGNAAWTIASRYDLRKEAPLCYGAFDTKLSSVKEIKQSPKKTIYLYSGATKQVEPLFSFNSDACINVTHIGIPDTPNNDWVTFNNKYNFDE